MNKQERLEQLKQRVVKSWHNLQLRLQGRYQEERRKHLLSEQRKRIRRMKSGQPLKLDTSYTVSVIDRAKNQVYKVTLPRYRKAKAIEAAVNEAGEHQAETTKTVTADGYLMEERKV